MKVSKRGQYGMRALCHLAETYGGGVVQIREIARKESIPGKFLEGILLELKHAGIVRSRRGIDGGYELARYWHFLFVWVFVAFTLLHVVLVLVVDPASLRAMITGWYRGRFPSHD